jgi:hypothetical protein
MRNTSILTLTCLNVEECIVFFEPWGSEHVLRRGDVFVVRSDAIAKGGVEVSFVGSGLSVCFSTDDDVTVTDKSGAELNI